MNIGADPRSLLVPPVIDFEPSSLADQPEPVQRHLGHAIAAGTPVALSEKVFEHRHERPLSPHHQLSLLHGALTH